MSVTVYQTGHRTLEPGRWWFVHLKTEDKKGALCELVSCPKCGTPMPVDTPDSKHRGDWRHEKRKGEDVLVTPSMICPCGFHDYVLLSSEEKPEAV